VKKFVVLKLKKNSFLSNHAQDKKKLAESTASKATTSVPTHHEPEGLTPAEDLLCQAFRNLLQDPSKRALAIARSKIQA